MPHGSAHVLWGSVPIRTLGRVPSENERVVQKLGDIPNDALEQRLFELANDALVVTTLDGEIRRANAAAAALAPAPRSNGRLAVTKGHGTHNDFVLVGPKSDPVGTRGKDITAALKKIAAANAPFISRGDKSGTHAAELRYWKDAGVDLDAKKGAWYRDTGSGMGPTLNTASSMNAYVLADRGTWLAFRNRGDLTILVEGDKRLFNQYGVMLVNPARHPHVKAALGQQFVDWLVSPRGQAAIAGYKIGGEQLFFPNANG